MMAVERWAGEWADEILGRPEQPPEQRRYFAPELISGKRSRRDRRRRVRTYIDRYFLGYVRILRGVLKRRGIPEGSRSPCHSCAFNPGTDTWEGFDSTVMGLMECLTEGRKPFICHEGLPTRPDGAWYLPVELMPTGWDPKTGKVTWREGVEPPPLCAGFAAVKDDPEAKRAHIAAIGRIGPPPPELRKRAGFGGPPR